MLPELYSHEKALRLVDHRFADWVVKQCAMSLSKDQQQMLGKLVRAVSYATYLKHTCLDLQHYQALSDPLLNELLQGITSGQVGALLSMHRLPLITSADGNRIWLQKYHLFEQQCALRLCAMANMTASQPLPEDMLGGQLTEEQKVAAQMAWSRGVAVITGGPGTGKTFTVGRIIALLLKQQADLRIELAAPTGKAGQRMTESIRGVLSSHELPSGMSLEARTLHSLLGIGHDSPKPYYHRHRRLALDVLIVDEASMIDLPMMYRLLEALPDHARLILLGDKDQLASVEAGNVLAELYQGQALQDCTVNITQSQRFDNASDIGRMAAWLNNVAIPMPSFQGEQLRIHVNESPNPWQPAWLDKAVSACQQLQKQIPKTSSVVDLLQQQKHFQLLCALRQGPYGVEGINRMVEDALGKSHNDWYPGKPLIILQNDRAKKLFNGDVGVVLPLTTDNSAIEFGSDNLKACFLMSDNGFRAVNRSQMPLYETCYALTVHKSQGSEYHHVMIVLPENKEDVISNPVLTRELAYTAVTRAREQVDIYTGKGVLQALANRQTVRMSGLAAMLS